MPDVKVEKEFCHRLFLIRHAETVDNIAGLYAGIRDSALTNHGVQQAMRLGEHFAKRGITFTHVFSSNLSRAIKTAQSICDAQPSATNTSQEKVEVVQVPELREQDFGFYEGKPFYARSAGSPKSGKDQHRAEHKNEEGFQDVESKESMAKRADDFLDTNLMPLLSSYPVHKAEIIAIVSHGIMLSSLWRCLLRRQPPGSVTLGENILAGGAPVSLEHLGGWSNTGYLELELVTTGSQSPPQPTQQNVQSALDTIPAEDKDSMSGTGVKAVMDRRVIDTATEAIISDVVDVQEAKSQPAENSTKPQSPKNESDLQLQQSFRITIRAINAKDHVKALKRTGGGVGSSKFDEGQKSIDSFFKRPRTK